MENIGDDPVVMKKSIEIYNKLLKKEMAEDKRINEYQRQLIPFINESLAKNPAMINPSGTKRVLVDEFQSPTDGKFYMRPMVVDVVKKRK